MKSIVLILAALPFVLGQGRPTTFGDPLYFSQSAGGVPAAVYCPKGTCLASTSGSQSFTRGCPAGASLNPCARYYLLASANECFTRYVDGSTGVEPCLFTGVTKRQVTSANQLFTVEGGATTTTIRNVAAGDCLLLGALNAPTTMGVCGNANSNWVASPRQPDLSTATSATTATTAASTSAVSSATSTKATSSAATTVASTTVSTVATSSVASTTVASSSTVASTTKATSSIASSSTTTVATTTIATTTQATTTTAAPTTTTIRTTTTITTTSTATPAPPPAEGLSGGAIAGIVIGSLAGAGLLGAGGYYLAKNRKGDEIKVEGIKEDLPMEAAQPLNVASVTPSQGYTGAAVAGAGAVAAGGAAMYGSQTSQGTGFTQYPMGGTAVAAQGTQAALESMEGEPATCIRPHIPQLSDELLLSPGDKVIIQKVHDDGWAQGTNLTSKVSGAFPLACVLRGE